MNGTIRSYDRRRGAGLIIPENGGPDIFVHISALERAGLRDLSTGDRVSFDIQTDRALKRSFAANLALLAPI